jgi:signal transduction histidine kinase
MTIRKKLSLIFTILVVSILILFSCTIYYFSSRTREESFYQREKNRATNTVRRLADTKGMNIELLKVMDKTTATALLHGNVALYNEQNQNIYNSNESEAIKIITPELLNKIRLLGELRYSEDKKEVVGILFSGRYGQIVGLASAIDENGFKSLHDLRLILIFGLIMSVIVCLLTGYLFSGQALKPISNVVRQVGNITVKNLNQRVSEGNGTDEIALLAIEFNKMLERLEAAFQMQRSFVSNASHELRTPLTSISGQIEIALMKKHNTAEYEVILQSIWEDIKNMNKLSNGLFDLAQASFDPSGIKLKNIRVDELVWQSRDELIKRQKDYTIDIAYAMLTEDENKLSLRASEHLLKTAIINVLDNACKYSPDKHVQVKIIPHEADGKIVLLFIDKGIGIDQQDIVHIFEPFYRASNVRGIAGHGIGLSLVERIVNLHSGKVQLNSTAGKGTTVTITLPLQTT